MSKVSQLAKTPGPAFNIDLIPGEDFANLEQAQTVLLANLPGLLAEAVRRGLELGAFKVVGNRIVTCDESEK